MSDQQPTPSSQGPVEYLGGPASAEPARGGRGRSGLVAGGAAAVVALGAAGAWGVATFMSGGQEAAEVVPADALGYVSLNLDPDGGQKLEAYQTLKKFPALEKYLDASSGGEDLRRALVSPVLEAADCPGVTFDDDVAPWLGNAVAMAALPGDKHPIPVAFLQVTDEDAAVAGLETLGACSEEEDAEDIGTAFADGWLVVAETDEQAQAAVDDAASGALTDDAEYQRWVEEAGGSGIVTAYLAPEAPAALLEAAGAGMAALDDTGGGGSEDAAALEAYSKAFDDFEGGASVVRFADEALEVESAFGGLPDLSGDGGDSGLQQLPDTTAVAYGFAVSDTFVQDVVDLYSEVLGPEEVDRFLAQGEQATGLQLPEDLQALLGDGVALALDGSADFSSEALTSPASVPVGLRITGDPSEIRPVLDKVLDSLTTFGLPREMVAVEEGDNAVAVAVTPDRAATLVEDGGLGDQSGFRDALPEADRADGGLYVGFDEGSWFTSLVEQAHDDELEANVEPLHSLGLTSWVEDGTNHGKLRLTTD